ncbi:MAG TPA: alpha-galactosidase [Clostridiales bacterium]|nr:alpha-galactosidase [Clostridiales bacterium]
MEKKIFDINGLKLIFVQKDDNLLFSGIDTVDAPLLYEDLLVPPFMLGVQGKFYGGNRVGTLSYSQLSLGSRLKHMEENEESLTLIYACTGEPLEVTVKFEKTKTASAVRVRTSVKNTGNRPISISALSSVFIQGIAQDEFLWNINQDRLAIHYCKNSGFGEGQWRTAGLSEAGIYYVGTHLNPANFHLQNTGSQSTSQYFPVVLVEDKQKNRIYFAEMETSSSWHIETGFRNAAEKDKGSFFMLLDAARERNSLFYVTLSDGESYNAEPAVIGCCPGGFDQAVKQLTLYRREKVMPAPAWYGECPVVYNDYMNTLWGNPTFDQLIPLIDAAVRAGAQVFCIDSGWYDKRGEVWGENLGDWLPSTDRYGNEDLQFVLDYIKSKGLIPGLWLEMEVANFRSQVAKNDDSWFICRNGIRVADGGRYFLDFQNSDVCDYMFSVIDRLMAMGIGYIKNDYNSCISSGDDKYGSPAYNMQLHLRCFYAFIDAVREKYPDLIIENCGGGAQRGDNGALSHFHLQSVSDQEIYHLMPSIVLGSLATVLPERLGIWSYPYPLRFKYRNNTEHLASPEYINSMANGEETIFNMITGMAGNLYLSGYLSYADEKNMALINEAVTLYKTMRSFIKASFPVYPCGLNPIDKDNSFAVLILENDKKSEGYLYVWRRGCERDTIEIPFHGYTSASRIYPSADEYSCGINMEPGLLKITLQEKYSARLIKLN